MDIGMAIRTLRTNLNLTQTELAERVGVSVNTVSTWETGKVFPPKDRIKHICKALGIPTSYLMVSSIEETDVPEDKRVLYRVLLEPFKKELLNADKVSCE